MARQTVISMFNLLACSFVVTLAVVNSGLTGGDPPMTGQDCDVENVTTSNTSLLSASQISSDIKRSNCVRNAIVDNLSVDGSNAVIADDGDGNCNRTAAMCNKYINKMMEFYTKVGGWGMLCVVFIGILCLAVTHFYAKHKLRKAGKTMIVTFSKWHAQRRATRFERVRHSKSTSAASAAYVYKISMS